MNYFLKGLNVDFKYFLTTDNITNIKDNLYIYQFVIYEIK